MKTNILYFPLLVLLSAVSLCGCSNDDEPVATATDGTTLNVTARADGFAPTDGTAQTDTPQTRASESGYTTTFVKGDQIGVFAVKGGSVITGCQNVPLTYNGTSWSGSAPVYKYAGATYFAYYPYTASMNSKTSVDEIVAAFNATVTTATDQSTYAKYTACDLMTTTGAVSPTSSSLSFSFTHKMSLIEISLPVQKYKTTDDANAYEYSAPVFNPTFSLTLSGSGGATTIKPYPMDNGIYRYIVPAGTSGTTVSGAFNTADNKTIEYSKSSLSLSAGNYKRLNVTYDGAPSATPTERALAVGDFYYSDGSICPGDASNPPSEGCIGIIYSTDAKRIGTAAQNALATKGVTTPHGLVMALTNASDGCRWGDYGKDENSGGADGTPFKANTDQLKKQYENVNGYAETHWIIDEYGKNGNTALQTTYTAFYHANRYGTTDSGTAQYAAPANTTGWFIPSMGQWWDILSNLGGINLDTYKESTGKYAEIDGAATTAMNNMNKYLQKINGTATFSTNTFFWSSSEYSGSRACNVGFYSYGYLGLLNDTKDSSTYRVRCSFAF